MNKPIDPNLESLSDDFLPQDTGDKPDKLPVFPPADKNKADFTNPDFTVSENSNVTPGDYFASEHHRSQAEAGMLHNAHRRRYAGTHGSHRSHTSGRRRRKHRHHHKRHRAPLGVRILLGVLSVLLALILIAVATFFGMDYTGKKNMKATTVTSGTSYEETIEYNGHTYVYNDNIITVAFIGVDKRSLGEKDTHTDTVGMADTDVVAAIDTLTGKTSMIAVPRDTMVDVDVYKDGKFIESKEMELCIAYAYGDGFASSCKNVTTSLSRILYNVPIDKYFAMDLDGIKPINDAIGGVTLESLYDFDAKGIQKGDKIHLTGDLTEMYVRTRDMDTVNASLNRTQRQVQYLNAFAAQAKKAVAKDFGIISKLYNTASDYCVTDITLSTATYMGSLLLSKGINSFESYTLEGKMEPIPDGEFSDYVYAAFYPDKDQLMQTVLDVFYQQVK